MEIPVMNETAPKDVAATLKSTVQDILNTIEQEREREIITRRFGLFDRRETLEQIGELLGITRERVRQLEKAILIRLKIAADDGKIPAIHDAERMIIRDLSENGRAGRIQDVTARLIGANPSNETKAHVAFIAELSPKLTVVNENDHYYQGVGIAEYGDEKKVRDKSIQLSKRSKNMASLSTSKRYIACSITKPQAKCAPWPAFPSSSPTSRISGVL